MRFPSLSSLATAVHNAPDQSIGISSNAPNGTSLADGVNNHDHSTHNGPQSDSAADKDSLEEGKEKAKAVMADTGVDSANYIGKRPSSSGNTINGTVLTLKRSRSESRIPASSHAFEASQEQPSVQHLLHEYVECDPQHTAAMKDQAQKPTDLIDRKLEEWPHRNTILMRSPDLHDIEQTTAKRKRFPDPWMTEIVPGLFLGDVPAATCPEMLRENNIDAIVSLCDTVWGWGWAMAVAGIPINRHIFIRCQDSETLDILVYMSDICDFIDRVASLALQQSSSLQFLSALPPSGSILVHCIAGRSRSPAVIVAYLMRKYRIKYEDAIKFVRTKRRVKPNASLVWQLRIWEQVGYNVWEDDERRIPKAPYQAYLDARAVQMDGERDHDAIVNARTALHALYPIGPKFEPPYCCQLVGNCPCKDSALPSASKLEAISSL